MAGQSGEGQTITSRTFWLIGLVAAAGVGFAVYFFPRAGAETPSGGVEKYIEAMSRKPGSSQPYIKFVAQATELAGELNRLQEQAGGKNWAAASQALARVRQAYEKAWLLAAPVEAELGLDDNVKGFLEAAGQSFNAQVISLDKKLRAEDMRLASLQQEVAERKARQAAPAPAGPIAPRPVPSLDYFQAGFIPWLAGAFVAGFALLIPWYKKFAEEEQYYSYSLTRTGRWSPVNSLMMAAIALGVILVAYALIKGYLGELL